MQGREQRRLSNSPVANNLERLIKEKDLKQANVARAAGMKPRNLSDILNGYKVVRANEILKLAIAIGVNVEELFKNIK